MSKPFTYWVRLATVATLCTLVTFNPVSAGRLIDRLLHRDSCKFLIKVAPTAPCQTIVQPCPVIVPCTGEGAVVDSGAPSPSEAAGDSSPSVSPAVVEPKAEQPTIVEPKVVEPSVDTIVPPAEPVKEPAATVETQPAPIAETPVVADPVEEAPLQEEVTDGATESEAPTEPTNDLFDVVESEPSAESANEQVTEPETDLGADPVVEPSEETNATDDLFGDAPAKETEPTQEPDDSAAADLFGDTPSDSDPAEKTAPASEDDLDNLFPDEPSSSEAAPEKPKTDDGAAASEDLFDGLFGKPVNTTGKDFRPANDPADEGDDPDKMLDRLFGNSGQTNPSPKEPTSKRPNTAPKSQPAAPAKNSNGKPSNAESELDKLFNSRSSNSSNGFEGAEFRNWVDNSGAYQVNARLAVIYADKVKLLKENGKFTTVPLNRLSFQDRDYVQWVAVTLTSQSTKMVNKNLDSNARDMAR